MRRRALLGVTVVLLAVAPAAFLAGPAAARVATSGIQIQLRDPGSSPRSLLRIHAGSAPAQRTVTYTTQVMQSGIATQTVGPLAIQARISFGATSKGPGGTIQFPYRYESFQLLDTSVGNPQDLDAVRRSLAQSSGLGGQFTLTSTGAVVSGHLVVPPGVSSTLRSLLEQLSDQSTQLSVPFPTQAVGIGAHWRATTHLSIPGIKVTQTYDYVLRSHNGTNVSLDVSYVQTAPHQRIVSSGLSPGSTVTLTGYRIAGSGSTTVDLSQIAPSVGHVAAQGLQTFRVQRGRQSDTLNQQVTFGIDIAPS